MKKLIEINIEPGDYSFDSQEELRRFHETIGYMVMFMMERDAKTQDVQLTTLYVARDKEVTGCHYRNLPYPQGDYDGQMLFHSLEGNIRQLKHPHPFVMGAVPSKGERGTTWTFHS